MITRVREGGLREEEGDGEARRCGEAAKGRSDGGRHGDYPNHLSRGVCAFV